ncbi:MAG: hypothetical protein RJB26_2536 [Pseudomonadota bacterium]|jgi:sulfite exporter TauE/SafE
MTDAALLAELAGATLTGLAAGGHCLGMCGGLQAALMPTATPGLWRLQIGRSAAYTLLGAVAGGLGTGAAVMAAPALRQFAGVLAFLALLSLAARLALRRDLLGLERLGAHLWKALQPLARPVGQWREPWRSYGLGMVWAFIPCGLVLSMAALAATTGKAWHGAALLGAFAVGTWPALLGTGFIANLAGKNSHGPSVQGMAWRRWALAFALLLLALAQLASLFPTHEHHHHTGMLSGFRDGTESLTLWTRAVRATA